MESSKLTVGDKKCHRSYPKILLNIESTGILLSVLILFLLMPAFLSATILSVKQDGTGDFTVIQEACLAATSGDTVLVYPGIYYENLHLNRPIDLTLASLFLLTQDRSYISSTIINGNQTGSCINIDEVSQSDIVIAGFTLTNGSGCCNTFVGGGIRIYQAHDVYLKSNVICNNVATAGAGIYVMFSKLFLSGNIIKNNRAYGSGGGIYNRYGSEIYFDDVEKNSVYLNYGAIGADIAKLSHSGPMDIILDTCTVLNPDYHFIYSYDVFNFPNNDINISVDHGKLTPVNQDLYVDPATGDDANDGLTPATALKTASFACKLIASDSTNPLTIHLLDGVYSPSTNQEQFPFNVRSYISLIGESKDNTIFDADSSYFFIMGSGSLDKFSIQNISFQNSYNSNLKNVVTACMYYTQSTNVSLENIDIDHCTFYGYSGIAFENPDNLLLKNINIDNLKGGSVLAMSNFLYPKKTFKCKNISIRNFKPDDNPMQSGGEGKGVIISGSLYINDLFTGSICNLLITDNLRIPNPNWGYGTIAGIAIDKRAKVNLVNATFSNNICRGEESFAANVDNGSVVNFYNTIMYGDSLKEFSMGNPLPADRPATANISYSNFEGGEAAIKNWNNQHNLNWLEGNMDEDPRWVGTGDTAYYLQYDSPCRNSGTPMYESGMSPPYIKEEEGKYVLYMHNMDTVHLPATDLAGRPRISGNRIDMGAYEYQDTGVAVQEYGLQQDSYKLSVYPNPFYVHAFVDFQMEKQGHVQIVITDLNGQRVKTLLDASMPRGDYHLIWKGDNDYGTTLRNGTYLLTLYNNGQQITTVKVQKQKF